MIGNWNYGTGRRKSSVARVFMKKGPAVGARAPVLVREITPGVAAGAVILAHRPPRPLAEIGADRLPGAGAVDGAFGEARVFGGRRGGFRSGRVQGRFLKPFSADFDRQGFRSPDNRKKGALLRAPLVFVR